MSRDPALYLQEIITAIEFIRRFTGGMPRDQFLEDARTQHACMRDLEVIGEAAKNVPDHLRQRETDIDWRKVSGLRDVLIHQYFGVDLEIVWDVITTKLDPLYEAACRLRDQLQQSD